MTDPAARIAEKLGHYRILEQIGAGGMGIVFRARDEHLERDVALKVLPPHTLDVEGSRKRFRKEALALSTLNHPNIAVVHDFDTQQEVDFLVTEYIPGVTLDQKLAGGALQEREVVSLGIQLAEGLAAAHRRGVIHRDIKPSNLRITNDGELKILDFGLAKLQPITSEATLSKSMTQTGTAVGTVPYMAPEQLRGEAVDARSDNYAMGAVLYEMATGHRPFPEKETPQLIAAILQGCPLAPRELNPAISFRLQEIVLKCLDSEPSRRYQSAAEVAVDLKRIAAPGKVSETRRNQRGHWRRRFSLAAAVVIALAMLLYAGLGRWRGRTLAPVPKIGSLAVLPLQNFSGDPQQDYFADGMTDELITQLAQTSGLRVISRSSVMQYKKTNKMIPEIARELKVDAVLEGSVERVGDRVRIQAQLIYAPNDQHLWAQQYDRELTDVLELQDEVTGAIAREVGVNLAAAQRSGGAERPRKVNVQAYDAYLRGQTASTLSQAITYFDQAIKLQPDFAPAYAEKANRYFFLGFLGFQAPSQVFSKMEEAAAKAVENDPQLAAGHAALALVKLHYDWDFPAAEREFRRALELNPSDADSHHLYGHYLLAMGRIKESVQETRLAMQLDPAGESLLSCIAWHELSGRNYERAVSDSRRAMRDAPDDFFVHQILGWTYEQQKLIPEATAELRKAQELSGGASLSQASLAHVLAISGNRREAQMMLTKMKAKARESYIPAYDLAVLYLGLGDKQSAIDWLQKAAMEHSFFLVYINWDPRFDGLRSDPRFTKILKQVGLPVKTA